MERSKMVIIRPTTLSKVDIFSLIKTPTQDRLKMVRSKVLVYLRRNFGTTKGVLCKVKSKEKAN